MRRAYTGLGIALGLSLIICVGVYKLYKDDVSCNHVKKGGVYTITSGFYEGNTFVAEDKVSSTAVYGKLLIDNHYDSRITIKCNLLK